MLFDFTELLNITHEKWFILLIKIELRQQHTETRGQTDIHRNVVVLPSLL